MQNKHKHAQSNKQQSSSRSPRKAGAQACGSQAKRPEKREVSPKTTATRSLEGFKRTHKSFVNHASAARLCALDLLIAIRERNAFAQDIIVNHIDKYDLSPEDKAFAIKLIVGVVMSQGTLDSLINKQLKDKSALEDMVRDALRISCYELMYLDKSSHAAVDQGVELVRSVKPRATGLANAVLRALSREAAKFPFGNVNDDIWAAARNFAFPGWLACRIEDIYGAEAARQFMAFSNTQAPIYLGINTCKATKESIVHALQQIDPDLEHVLLNDRADLCCYKLSNPRLIASPALKQLIDLGVVVISDASAQSIVAQSLPLEEPRRMLEIGSGKGTKTILFQSMAQQLYGSQLKITTLDLHDFKREVLENRLAHAGIQCESQLVMDARKVHAQFAPQSFDFVFIDAPCTGLGTLRRHPEIRWRVHDATIEESAQLGYEILWSAAHVVSVGGELSFATCTINPEENEQNIIKFLQSELGQKFKLIPFGEQPFFQPRLSLAGPDAHFCARLVRTSA